MTDNEVPPETVTRRTVLAVGMAGAAGVALAACGGGDTASESTSTGEPTNSPSASPTASQPSGSPAGSGTNIGSVDQVAVGSATIIAANDTAFVVAQPEEGRFVAHSAVCPHQGCLCNRIADGEAICPCHGSKFDAVTGAVEQGPATTGLAPAAVTVENGQLFIS